MYEGREKMRAFVVAAMVWLMSASGALAGADPAVFDRLLSRYVAESADGVNRVDYRAWKAAPADMAALDGYIAALARETPARMARPAQFAYWVNLYNALTLQEVLRFYPVASIRDIKSRGVLDFGALIGPWKTKLVTVEGRALSLDDIEHAILRPTFRDPRVHYAVNCASIGCPNLQREAFRAERLEAQLDGAARAFIASPRAVRVQDGRLRLSSIYDWFRADFGTEAALLAHLARYAPDAKAGQIRSARGIAGYDYDWSLNVLRRQ
jgi:hypothetical protein